MNQENADLRLAQSSETEFRINNKKFGEIFQINPMQVLKVNSFAGPLIHVGSKINYEDDVARSSAERLRAFYRENLSDNDEVYGLDIFEGYNVDIVADLCDENLFLSGDLSRYKGYFKTAICWAVLEHVENPFLAAKNISDFLAGGGKIYYIGPWVWGYHPYPDDYWRISFSALQVLFPCISWDDWWYSGTSKDVGYRIKALRNERKVFQMQMESIQEFSAISDRSLPYANINALGTKNAS
ncbi:MAG: class I SAM-dependent methyltransferase [Leptolyngbya sp. SIO3F4]|nr:class I SAM-dependent methyltransferase [Leptolyngbya sp. SIO3F4]